MEKRIKCLKEEVSKLRGYAVIIDGEGGEWEPVTTVSVEDIYELINQLDKLEVLSQEFINEKAVEIYADTADAEVHTVFRMRDLQSLLVPKQDEREQLEIAYKDILSRREFLFDDKRYVVVEKPVIPQFVADWIETCKEFIDYDGSTINIFDSQHETDTNLPLINTATEKERGKVYDWIADYSEKYARAWLDGYTVEKEQKYYVLDKEGHLLIRGFSDGTVGRVGDRMKPDLYPDWNKKNLPLTEQEIKDYDPRYFAFAVKVGEMEE